MKTLPQEKYINNRRYKMSASMNENKEIAQRIEKHIELNNAINEIDKLREHVNHVLLKITGGVQPEPAVSDIKQPVPTLQEVLNQSPEEIRELCNVTHQILDEIEHTLF
jgi:hypothetical protein